MDTEVTCLFEPEMVDDACQTSAVQSPVPHVADKVSKLVQTDKQPAPMVFEVKAVELNDSVH